VDITEVLRLLRDGTHEMYPVAAAHDIAMTESALGRPLPDSYKTFVTEFSNGAYLYQLQEVSAVGDGNEQIAPIQKIVRAPADIHGNTDIAFREGGGTAQYGDLIPFCLDHNANEWCFVGNSSPPSAEYEVAYFDTAGRKLYGRLPSFTAWLERLIETQDEVIRTLYDEDVLYDELNLG
jgi:hypothetical protein